MKLRKRKKNPTSGGDVAGAVASLAVPAGLGFAGSFATSRAAGTGLDGAIVGVMAGAAVAQGAVLVGGLIAAGFTALNGGAPSFARGYAVGSAALGLAAVAAWALRPSDYSSGVVDLYPASPRNGAGAPALGPSAHRPVVVDAVSVPAPVVVR